jgi:hypothetical protein
MSYAPTTHPHTEKQASCAELVAAGAEFHRLLDTLAPEDWRRHSRNPEWTNGEILFHMALGFVLLPLLLPLMRLLGHFPRSMTKPFAAALNLATGPFNWDALFQPYMTVPDLLRYPIVHMRFHADQLAPHTTETARP